MILSLLGLIFKTKREKLKIKKGAITVVVNLLKYALLWIWFEMITLKSLSRGLISVNQNSLSNIAFCLNY